MVRYLLNHTISVFVSVGLLVALGVLAWLNIPTSLLPDIPVPEIIVKTNAGDLPASETDRLITEPLRQKLAHTAHLRNIDGISSAAGSSTIKLTFDYGTRMDAAYMEVGEKVDEAMRLLPSGCPRPVVEKVSATDIPVFTLFVAPRRGAGPKSPSAFLEICNAVEQSVRPRLEQLSSVAMADVSGTARQSIEVVIDRRKAAPLGLGSQEIEAAFNAANVDAAGATVSNRGMVYNIRMETQATTARDIGNISLSIPGGRIIALRDIADIHTAEPRGSDGRRGAVVVYNGERAVALNVMKHPGARMADFENETAAAIDALRTQYPDCEFAVTGNQARLLQSTLSSLVQNLWLGLLLIFLISAVFLHQGFRLSVVVAISMTSALVISIGVLYLFRISLNIISLVGLILSVGMMIDNSLIVADDIGQYSRAGFGPVEACARGTGEVITPMLSSMLTTVAVFLPLVFGGGISGELFRDQAYSITLSLIVSYLVAIIFLPVLYKAVCWRGKAGVPEQQKEESGWLWRSYHRATEFTFRHGAVVVGLAAVAVPLCVVLVAVIPRSLMPQIDHNGLVARIDWGAEGTAPEANMAGAERLAKKMEGHITGWAAYIGPQQFVMGEDRDDASAGQCRIDFTTAPQNIENSAQALEERLAATLRRDFPGATFSLSPPASAIEAVFPSDSKELLLKLLYGGGPNVEEQIFEVLRAKFGSRAMFPKEVAQIDITPDTKKMARYGLSLDALQASLRAELSGNQAIAQGGGGDVPVVIRLSTDSNIDIRQAIKNCMVETAAGNRLPAAEFVAVRETRAPERIYSGMRGHYTPVKLLETAGSNYKADEQTVASAMSGFPAVDYEIESSALKSRAMVGSLLKILAVSLVLMYLIMTAQFGSFLQPLILLTEIPVDLAAGLLALWAAGHSLNVMSAIGLVVACGIVVNDSILKVSVINRLRAEGVKLQTGIHEAGRRRLRAIVTTSLTSIFVFVPVMMSSDIGSEMQKPLAIAMVGAMTVGTLYSLFVVPLLYWMVYRGAEKHKLQKLAQ